MEKKPHKQEDILTTAQHINKEETVTIYRKPPECTHARSKKSLWRRIKSFLSSDE